MNDEYWTVAKAARAKIPVEACRFIASVTSCTSDREARDFVAKVKEEFHDATHNASAYRIGFDGSLSRSDDDHEPAGSAGHPMLKVLESRNLVNVVVVGTRYFGGVKLGVGGLIRAYRRCAISGVEAAGVCKKILMEPLQVNVAYEHLGLVLQAISAYGGKLSEQYFSSEVQVNCLIRASGRSLFEKYLFDQTGGKVYITRR